MFFHDAVMEPFITMINHMEVVEEEELVTLVFQREGV